MLSEKRLSSANPEEIREFLNNTIREIVNEINNNLRANFVKSYFKDPNGRDGMIGYFPCRPALYDTSVPPVLIRPADFNPGSGQGAYIWVLNSTTKVGKWHKFNTTPVP